MILSRTSGYSRADDRTQAAFILPRHHDALSLHVFPIVCDHDRATASSIAHAAFERTLCQCRIACANVTDKAIVRAHTMAGGLNVRRFQDSNGN